MPLRDHGEAPGLVREAGGRGECMGETLYCVFLGKEWTRWDKVWDCKLRFSELSA